MAKMASRASWCKNLLAYTLQRCKKTCIDIGVCRLNSSLTQLKPRLLCNSSQPSEFFYHTEFLKPLCEHQSVRYYAKTRDKKKSDKGQKKKVQVNEELVADVINVQTMREQMQTVVDKLKEDFMKNLSLRSTTGSIETLPVSFEGKDYILQDLAQVVRKNPKTVIINMSAFPQVIPTVLQAISKSGMNLNPQQDGTTIFIPIPKVTKEHRENLAKNAKTLFIKCRDGIKDVQNKSIKNVKTKEKEGLARDTAIQICDYIEFVATEHISGAEKIMEAKQQELLNEM